MLPIVVIAGRPNVGKSTLFNRLAGRRIALVADTPGVTRDRKEAEAQLRGRMVRLIDTAGLEEAAPETLAGRMRAGSASAVSQADLVLFVLDARAGVEEPLEKMSVSSAIQALKMAEVVVLTLDAVEGIHDQDLQIARLIEREGRACIVALNKWDAVADRSATRKAIMERLEESLAQMKGIPVVTLSALTGAGVDRLLPAVRLTHEVWNKRIPTGELNRWFEHALDTHQAPLVSGRRLKLRYVTQAKARPPTFVVFGTRAEQTPEDYTRYLVNSLRDTFKLPGTPIRLQLRGTKNPFVDDE